MKKYDFDLGVFKGKVYIDGVFKNTSIDQSMRHKNLTQVWQLNSYKDEENCKSFKDVIDSKKYSSTHFSRIYNGYLKNENLEF